MTMFIHFFCLCPLGLTNKLNFNISKATVESALSTETIYVYFNFYKLKVDTMLSLWFY